MPGELLCPDCGGVVGAIETTDAGKPCTCFTSPGADASKSETAFDMPAPQAEKPKLCVVCGKDVTGHRRLKDSRGYICYDCAKQEQRKERGDRIRCGSCGKLVKESALNQYEDMKICDACLSERKALQKQQIKRMGIIKVRDRTEKSRLYWMLAVAGLLLLIILLSKLHVLPRF